MIWRTEQDKTRLYVVEAVEEKNKKKKNMSWSIRISSQKGWLVSELYDFICENQKA